MDLKNQYSARKHRVVIALGDPAGIGGEIILKALTSELLPSKMQPLLVGCKKNLELTYSQLKSAGIKSIANPKDLEIENLPIKGKLTPGKPNAEAGDASFRWLTHSTELLMRGEARALVTAPISKHSWHQAGHIYAGQTERLAKITKSEHPSMLFTAVSPKTSLRLNILLATTHIPLSEVPQKLTPKLIESKLNALLTFCKRFKKKPRLAIAGLNPHSGEAGKIGQEEVQWLIPVLKQWQANNPTIELDGPLPPDTCWINASKAWTNKMTNSQIPDGFLALYHDQGLIPMKLIAFEEAVNTTLGLPFIRTSPDHGTAFNIAGKGCADEKSMIAALKTSWELSEKQ